MRAKLMSEEFYRFEFILLETVVINKHNILTGYSSNSTDVFFSTFGCWSSAARLSYLSNVKGSRGFWKFDSCDATILNVITNKTIVFQRIILMACLKIFIWKQINWVFIEEKRKIWMKRNCARTVEHYLHSNRSISEEHFCFVLE